MTSEIVKISVKASAAEIYGSTGTKTLSVSSDEATTQNADTVTEITFAKIPLPKNTIGIIYGQMTAAWAQRFKTYLIDADDNEVSETKIIWDCTKDKTRFSTLAGKNEHCYGPFTKDYHIAVHCMHKQNSTDSQFKQSEPYIGHHDFDIEHKDSSGKSIVKHGFKFTMVHTEDGGDNDKQDTVVGVSVAYMTTEQ